MKFCENCGAPVEAQPDLGAAPAQQGGAGAAAQKPELGAQAIRGCGVKLAIQRFFQNYVEFRGRASRSEYWWAMLAVLALNIIGGWVGQLLPTVELLLALALLLPSLAVFVRREHDIGRRWTRIFVLLIPVVGWILLLVDMVSPSEDNNRFGPAPIDCPEDAA